MRKFLLLSFLTIWSATAFSATATSVRLNSSLTLAVTGTTNTTFTLNTATAGDPTSEGTAVKIYVPMDGNAAIDEINYFSVKAVTALFTAASAYTVNLPLYLNSTSSNHALYLAVKDTSSAYKIAAISAGPFNDVTNVDNTFSVSTAAMCTQTTECSTFGTTSGTERTFLVYAYLSDASLPVGTTIVPGSFNGIYFEIKMSNRIYLSSSVIPTISSINSGDGRVIINYSSNAGVVYPKATRVYNHGGTTAAVTALSPIRDYFTSGGALTSDEYTYATSGVITLSGLTNGTSSYFSVLFVDQFGFASVLSDDILGESKSIEELLKKNACFLLTAGFGEEHFVINYFRNFRDTVLLKSFLGRSFIHYYYELAPKYALLLYKSDTLRAIVRGGAYLLYFMFNYGLILLACLVFGALLYKNREKIKI